jgi:hypothetical protein
LVVAGGVGIGGNVYIGGTLNVSELKLTGTTQSTSPTTGALIVAGGVGIGKNLNVGGSGTIAQNFTAVTGQTSSFTVQSIGSLGSPNGGAQPGYLLLAKAYVIGFQVVSHVSGDFIFKRGSTTNSERTDIYRVMSVVVGTTKPL